MSLSDWKLNGALHIRLMELRRKMMEHIHHRLLENIHETSGCTVQLGVLDELLRNRFQQRGSFGGWVVHIEPEVRRKMMKVHVRRLMSILLKSIRLKSVLHRLPSSPVRSKSA